MGAKTCIDCKRDLPRDEFIIDRSRKDGRRSNCRDCWNEKRRSRYKANPDAIRAAGKRYYDNNKDAYREYDLRRRFGITVAQYEELLDAQGGVCAICARVCGTGRRLAVDHDHGCCPGSQACGECVRGLLCANCNRAIGLLRDDQNVISQAARYLADHQEGGQLA